MTRCSDDTPIEKQKAKALRVAMALRDRQTGEFAAELGVNAAMISKWRTHGRFDDRSLSVLLSRLGYTLSEFLALGEE